MERADKVGCSAAKLSILSVYRLLSWVEGLVKWHDAYISV